jgi:RNA-binding protein 5/10
LREVARQKVDAARQAEQPKYRDRASERRIMHNQPEVPVPAPSEKDKSGKKKGDGPAVPPSPPALNPGEDQNNVGNKLMRMMGWTEGSGLGTEADGRVEPMSVVLFFAFLSFVIELTLFSV